MPELMSWSMIEALFKSLLVVLIEDFQEALVSLPAISLWLMAPAAPDTPVGLQKALTKLAIREAKSLPSSTSQEQKLAALIMGLLRVFILLQIREEQDRDIADGLLLRMVDALGQERVKRVLGGEHRCEDCSERGVCPLLQNKNKKDGPMEEARPN